MEAMPRLSFGRRQADDVLILDLVGNLMLGPETHLMRKEMDELLQAGHAKVLLNLSRVRYIDSTGVGVLLAAKTSAMNLKVELKVCCVPPVVARLLQQLRLTRILEVHEQEDVALESFR